MNNRNDDFAINLLNIPRLKELGLYGKTYILKTAMNNRFYTADINSQLGSGGFGVVYDGTFLGNNNKPEASAIKYMIITDETFFDRMVSECKFAMEISYTCSDIAMKTFHITTFDIYDAGYRQINIKLLVICMEKGGMNLENFLLDNKNNSDDARIGMIESAIECAIRLNKRGFIHGDCYPKNMVISNGQIKFIDFGFSQYFNKNDFSTYGGIRGRGDESFVTTGVINNSIIPVDALFLISFIMHNHGGFKLTNVLYRLVILFNTLYYECNRLSKINIQDMFTKNRIFNKHVDDLIANIELSKEYNVKFDYLLLDNFMNGAFNDDKYNKFNDVTIDQILTVDRRKFEINVNLHFKKVVENKKRKDTYGAGYTSFPPDYDYSDVLSYNKNKCLTAKTSFSVKDILRHNLIPDTSRCLNECKIKSIYKYFEICLSYCIINDDVFCQQVINNILEPCINVIVLNNVHMADYSLLYNGIVGNGKIYEDYPYLYSDNFVALVNQLKQANPGETISHTFNKIEGYSKEKMLFYILYLRYFSHHDGSNTSDWEDFRQNSYRRYIIPLQSGRKKWKIENGGITNSRNNIVVPSFQHNYNEIDREKYFDNSNDDWGAGRERCLNSKTHIMNKYSRKVGIPIVCGISGTTFPMCWKVLCYLNTLLTNMVLTKNDSKIQEMYVTIRSYLFLYILACYSFLASDGGHSLNEVLSSFKMIFCIIENEHKNNRPIPFSSEFIYLGNHFFHDILIYDQSFERDRKITDLERTLLTVEREIYGRFANAKIPIIPIGKPDQNYYRFFEKSKSLQPMKDRIFGNTMVYLNTYMNYYCPLQQDDSLYTESKFDFFKKENNETLGFGKYKNKKGPQNKKKGLRREKSPVFDRGTIKFKKI